MQITKLDHVNIRTTQLDTMIDWYTSILGFHNGDRPASRSVGAWMYIEDNPLVHLVEINNEDAIWSDVELKLEHFAFSAGGLSEFEDKLRASDIPFRRTDITQINIAQVNVWDPDGNHIHIDFKIDE